MDESSIVIKITSQHRGLMESRERGNTYNMHAPFFLHDLSRRGGGGGGGGRGETNNSTIVLVRTLSLLKLMSMKRKVHTT